MIFSSDPVENAQLAASNKALKGPARTWYNKPKKLVAFQPIREDLIRFNAQARTRYARPGWAPMPEAVVYAGAECAA